MADILHTRSSTADVLGEAAVVDTSIVFKWFTDDSSPDVHAHRELMDAHVHSQILLAAPSVLPHAVHDALLSSGADPSRVLRAGHALRGLHLALVEPSKHVVNSAIEIHADTRIGYYGSLFAALAADLGVPLVTTDERQTQTRACRVHLIG